jgi:hypothetical protein
MMDRRTWLQSLARMLPATAAIRMEEALMPGDLVIVTCPGSISVELADLFKSRIEGLLPPGVATIVVGDGIRVHVERGMSTRRT